MKRVIQLAVAIGYAVCLFCHDSGDSESPVQVAWLGALIGGVTSIAGGILGSSAANKRLRQANEAIDRKQRRLDAWRNAEMGANFLDRADSRAALRRVDEYNREARKASDTEAVKRGMTDEAKVAQAARLSRGYADVVSQIAAAGQRHKDQVQQQYMAETGALENMKIQNLMDTSGAANLAKGIAGAGAQLAESLADIDWPRKKTGENAMNATAGSI